MVAIAEFDLDLTAVPLKALFERLPLATIELERVVPFQNTTVPYFWITSDTEIDFETELAHDEGIERLTLVDRLDGQALVRIEWAEEYVDLATAIVMSDVTLLSAVGTADGWRVEVRGDNRDAVSQFHEFCTEHGLSPELLTLHEMLPLDDPDGSALTGPQREAMRLAYDRGYYDTPRTTTLEELAASLGISRQAVAMRLKRGTRNLVEQALLEPSTHD